jgi:hypothetical protein
MVDHLNMLQMFYFLAQRVRHIMVLMDPSEPCRLLESAALIRLQCLPVGRFQAKKGGEIQVAFPSTNALERVRSLSFGKLQ